MEKQLFKMPKIRLCETRQGIKPELIFPCKMRYLAYRWTATKVDALLSVHLPLGKPMKSRHIAIQLCTW